MKDEDTQSARYFQNERTMHLSPAAALRPPSALGARPAFLAAHERLRDLAEAATGPALVIAAVDSRARVVDACLVRDRTALVIGRHSECGLRLSNAAVALRQIALLARHDGDRMQVHLWDLNTEHPFSTEDGAATSALVSDGPVYLATEEYVLWIVPSQVLSTLPERARDAWEALPERHFLDRRSPSRRPPARRWVEERSADRFGDHITHVTMCAPPLLLQQSEDARDAVPEIGWGVLRLASGAQKARHPVSAERLERGVLLGRYERCGLTIGGMDSVSRVHLLVVRIGDEVWAIDTASTNGVQRRGQHVSAVLLDAQDELVLARSLSVSWTREIHPQA
jgi:hypothetical protein